MTGRLKMELVVAWYPSYALRMRFHLAPQRRVRLTVSQIPKAFHPLAPRRRCALSPVAFPVPLTSNQMDLLRPTTPPPFVETHLTSPHANPSAEPHPTLAVVHFPLPAWFAASARR